MEMWWWNLLNSYFKQMQGLFFKDEGQEGLGISTSGRHKELRNGWRRVNMAETLHICIWKWKNETCWNYSKKGMGG
jgi:hypothetical protein